MKNGRKLVGAVLAMSVLISIFTLCFSLPSGAEGSGAQKTVNVWLIGGQSNAVGYGKDAPLGAAEDSRYYTGFDNVLYYGNHEQWKYNEDDFVPTAIGLGRTADNNDVRYTSSGSEIGIAKALADTGEMNAIIKFAYGGTYLYPKESASINDNAKTWTSPSYLQAHPEMNTGNNIGALYDLFVDTVTEGLALLREKGYTPVIKGMWWMQGENEGMNATHAAAYEELLTCLINDVRAELKNITGVDCSDMPFICGNVMRNPGDATQYPALDTVNAAQAAVASKLNNVGVLTKADYSSQSFFGYHDGWHFNADTYDYMGKKFVQMSLDMTRENLVSVSGEGIEVSGCGIKSEGQTVTVTVSAKDGYTVNGITLAGNPITLDGNGSYTFTMGASDVLFNVNTTYSSADAVTDYGTVPAEFNVPEKYPFVLFKNGAFVGAYEFYGKALSAVPTAEGADGHVLLLRRDYTTVTADSSTAVSDFGGSFTLDLGGNAMVRGNRAYVFEIYSNNNNTYKTTLNVKNGSMHSTGDFSLISLDYSSLSNVSKVYNIDFEGVIFATDYNGRGTPVIIDTIDGASTTDSAGLTANVTFNGCTFDFGESSGAMMKFSNASAAKTVVNAAINGGNIVSKVASYTLYLSSAEDNVVIGTFNGSYPTVTLPTSVTPPAYTYVTEAGRIYGIATDSGTVSGENTVYTMGEQSLNTKYGAIGEAFKDSQTYKFALFKTDAASATGYTFVSGYSTFAEVCNAAGLKGSPVVKDVDFVILLRTSFTNEEGVNNMQKIYNKVDIDLGGNTVTLTKQHFLPLYDNPSADTEYSTITVKNGTIFLNSPSHTGITAITVDSGDLTKKLTYNVAAENVTFKVASGSKSRNGALSMSGNKGSNNLTVNATFTNCTFDYTGAPAGTAMLNVSATQRIANVNVIGGRIIADTNNAFAFANTDSADKISFKANANGMTAELYLASGTAAPVNKIGDLEFVYERTENGNDVYTLVEKHAYGDIPAGYTAVDDYPVLLFKADKTFVRGYASFAEAAIAAGLVNGGKSSQVDGADAVILFRCDHVHIGESGNMNGYYNNVTIDLGGHTVQIGSETVKKNFLVLYPNAAYAADKSTFGTITVKNGTFRNMWDNTSALCFNGGGNVSDNITYTVNYENVTFTAANRTNKVYGAIRTWSGAAKNIKLNATYNDCTFDYTGANTNAGMFGLSYNSNTVTVFNITINGGRIVAGANNAFNFIEADASDKVTFGENAQGEYTKLSLTAGTAAPTGKYNNDTVSFVYSETIDGYDIYELSESKTANLSIGLADTGMTDMAKYALFVYVNGSLVSLPYSADLPVGTKITVLAKGAGKNNYSVTINGDAAEELSFTLSQKTAVTVGITEKSTVNKITVSSVTSSHTAANSSWAIGKLTDGIRVTSSSSNGYSTAALGAQTLSVPVVLVFDLGSVQTVNQIGMFPRSDLTAVNKALSANYPIAFTVEVSQNGTDYETVLTVNGEELPLFGKQYCYSFADRDAQFIKITITKISDLVSNEANSTRYRIQLAEVEVYYNEEISVSESKTLDIKTENADVANYALSVYLNGELISLPYSAAFPAGSTVSVLAKTPGKNNYVVTVNGTPCEKLDLVITEDTELVFCITENASVIKKPVSSVTANNGPSNTSWSKDFLIDGNRVSVGKLGYTSDWRGTQDLGTTPLCLTFDLGTVQLINQVSLFPRSTSHAMGDASLSCNYPLDFTISVSENGIDYITVVDVKDCENPRFKQQCYSFENVEARYVKITVTRLGLAAYDEGTASAPHYRLQLAEVEIYYNSTVAYERTEYGNIPAEYLDKSTYPVVVFGTDGSFLGGYASFAAAADAVGIIAKTSNTGKGVDSIILFRTDLTHNTSLGDGNTHSFYNNVIIDLGGNTVTLKGKNFLSLYIYSNTAEVHYGKITVKNGAFINTAANTAPVCFSGGKNVSAPVHYTVSFENVTFSAPGGAKYYLVARSWNPGCSSYLALDLTLTDCTFDLTGAHAESSIFGLSYGGNTQTVYDVKVIGSRIVAGEGSLYNFIEKDASDSIVFAKGANGSYVTLELPEAADAPKVAIPTEGGDRVFVKAAQENGVVTYKLAPASVTSFVPKMSITLDADLIANIYVPTSGTLKFTLDGTEYADMSALETVICELDGISYYRMSIPLASSEAARDIILVATVDAGDSNASGTFTFNTVSYAKALIAGGSAVEATLAKDILSYVRAAYIYFGRGTDAAVAEIGAVLGEGYDEANKPALAGSAESVTTGLVGATLVLDATPAIRFYLAEDADASRYAFCVGGVSVNTSTGTDVNGRYIELDVYAYRMCDTVTYTVDGAEGGSYHINSYYTYAKENGTAELVCLVERFAKYCESAAAYRASVIGQ